MMDPHFNLIDEPWIPIVGKGNVSLKQLFSSAEYVEIGGNPIQKIAITRLLLAIAQSAHTPKSEDDCIKLGPSGMAGYCLMYLDKHREAFWLYGERPFLQMPEIKKAKLIKLCAALPDVAIGNNTLFFETQKEKNFEDAEKALLIVTLMGFALGNKRTDNTHSLSKGYEKKSTGKPGPCLGYSGYLHNFVIGSNVHETLWLNLLSKEQLLNEKAWSTGLGIAPWERMPSGENCPIANDLKESYLGRLIPLSRFCLLSGQDLHYSEGIAFSTIKEGGRDPSLAINYEGKELKAVFVDPEKRPWRMVTSFLSFLGETKANTFKCLFLSNGMNKAKLLPSFGIWSGGLRVSNNAGEQFVSGSDDFVESKILLSPEILGNNAFNQFEEEMKFLDSLSKILYSCVTGYYKEQNADGSKHAKIAANLFWQVCEKHSQELFSSQDPKKLRTTFKEKALNTYDLACHNGTARQLNSWVKNRPVIKT